MPFSPLTPTVEAPGQLTAPLAQLAVHRCFWSVCMIGSCVGAFVFQQTCVCPSFSRRICHRKFPPNRAMWPPRATKSSTVLRMSHDQYSSCPTVTTVVIIQNVRVVVEVGLGNVVDLETLRFGPENEM